MKIRNIGLATNWNKNSWSTIHTKAEIKLIKAGKKYYNFRMIVNTVNIMKLNINIIKLCITFYNFDLLFCWDHNKNKIKWEKIILLSENKYLYNNIRYKCNTIINE